MTAREIILDVPMVLRMLKMSEEFYEKRQKPEYANGINIKKYRDEVFRCIVEDLRDYYGVAYEDLEFDVLDHQKNLKTRIAKLLQRGQSQSSFAIGRLPAPPQARKRPRCK